MACANHVCDNSSGAACISCPLCHSVAYCSEQCRVIDWVGHDCANVLRVTSPNQTIFRPYFYEDRMSAEELGPVPAPGSGSPLLQSYLAVQYGGDHKGVVYEIPALIAAQSSTGWAANFITPVRGVNPKVEKLQDSDFTVRATLFEDDNMGADKVIFTVDHKGSFLQRTIYEGSPNEDVNRLLGEIGWTSDSDSRLDRVTDLAERTKRKIMSKTSKQSKNFIFWPKITKQTAREFPAFGNLRVELFVGAVLVMRLSGGYDLRASALQSKLSGIFKKSFETRVKGKFRSASGMFPLIAVAQDVKVTATFSIAPGGAKGMLLDLEVMVPVDQVHEKLNASVRSAVDASHSDGPGGLAAFRELEKTEFRCDPRDSNDLNGLTLAIETTLATNKEAAANEEFQNNAGIVRSYARHVQDKLKCVAPRDIPMDVNTAVRAVVDALYEYNISK